MEAEFIKCVQQKLNDAIKRQLADIDLLSNVNN